MSYVAAIEFLYGLQLFGANFGLETTRKLAALAGNPQTQLRFIHVAGTNGKGSTCAMLESIYRAAGLRVGLFTSPHLVSFRERIQVDRKLISQADMARLVAELERGSATRSTSENPTHSNLPAALVGAACCGSQSRAPGDGRDASPTFFEFITVMALKFFAEQKCDVVIWETGLGGRLDATNIVTPLASVITNIALDHQQWLGDTLEKIAAEKAGIIKPGVPVITAASEPEALRVIEETARGKNAPLTVVAVPQSGMNPPQTCSSVITAALSRDAATLPLPGEHQKLNAALAVATVSVLQKQIPVSDAQIHAGLAQVNWPGRLQLIERAGGRKILLDGAHNVAGAEALRAALRSGTPSTVSARCCQPDDRAEAVLGAPTLILGVLGDKDWSAMCEIFAPLASRILIVPVNSPRTAATQTLADICHRANPSATVTTCASLSDALRDAANDPFVVITGSLYLVGEALQLLGEAKDSPDERGLNEWGTTRR